MLEAKTPTRARRLRRRLTLVGLGLALPCAVAELGLRILDPAHTAEVIERERFADAVLERGGNGALALKPGAVGTLFGHEARIGAHGFRTPPVATPKPADVYRILVVGDSVAFGWGVSADDAFPRVMERELNAGPIPGGKARVEVIDAAVPGWGVPHEFDFLRTTGVAWQPDLVIVTLINNDLTDVLATLDESPQRSPFLLPGFLRWSYLARIVEQTIGGLASDGSPADFFLAIDVDPARRATAVAQLCEAFAAMKQLLGEVPLCVVDTIVGVNGERLDDFVRCATSRGFARIDASLARPDYREVFAVGATDDHPNAAGHRELARVALEWIRAQ